MIQAAESQQHPDQQHPDQQHPDQEGRGTGNPVDHRRIGRELGLFDTDPMIGAGLPFWLPAGAAARYEVESYVRELERRAGYQHVYSPPMGKREMYERSGHLAHFADDMFPPMDMGGEQLFLRPSLCPHHALMFRARPRSYRDLPVRIAEIGGQYRAERSGVLGGLGRVRGIWLNDSHNFCALDQVGAEIVSILGLMREAHAALGVVPVGFRLSLRGPLSHRGGKFAGTSDMWDQAEALLRDALDEAGVAYVEESGEAAFYGPKIDVQIADPVGRESTLATIQVDFHQPEQFGLAYADADGGKSRPVMVHRSLVGSMERLFAYLIEAHAGAFPVWYSPVQALVVPVGEEQAGDGAAFARRCVEAGLRAEVAYDGTLGARIREASARKIPYVAVIGAREVAEGSAALRLRDGRQLAARPVAEVVAMISEVAGSRSHELVPAPPVRS